MDRPLNDDGGSGLHLHLSQVGRQGDDNRFADTGTEDGLSEDARHFVAGVIKHMPTLMALHTPTINSYKRLVPGGSVPTAATWGYDRRDLFVRVPPGRGEATRLEIRAPGGSANAYLAIGVRLLAGLDGMERTLEPPPAVDREGSGAEVPVGAPLPRSLKASLVALRAYAPLCQAIGSPLIEAFCVMKEAEIERFNVAGH